MHGRPSTVDIGYHEDDTQKLVSMSESYNRGECLKYIIHHTNCPELLENRIITDMQVLLIRVK
jgi:hypothetical protein